MTSVKKRLTRDAERVNPIESVHIWHSPPGAAIDMLVVTHLNAYSAIHEHATEALPNETGGFLIGRVAYDHRDGCWHLEIEETVPVEPESQNPVHFTFTWRDVDRVRSYREEHNKALIGWYHTHPDIGIFLSETDLERTHRVLFSEPFQVALVYDPVRGRAGYFFWEGAQKIDASQAGWREFDIAVALEPREDTPTAAVGALPAQAEEAIAAAQATVPAIAVSDTGSAIQRRRLHAIDLDQARSPLQADSIPLSIAAAPSADATATMAPVLQPAIAAWPVAAAPRTRRGARALWTFLGAMLLVIVGLAVGYFWFGPGRG